MPTTNFPDRALQFLEKYGEELEILDFSSKLFEEHMFCFEARQQIDNDLLNGIGVDSNEETAASKCLSELIERKLTKVNKQNPMGTAFHPDIKVSKKNAENELVERLTLCLYFTKPQNCQVAPLKPKKLPKFCTNLAVSIYEIQAFQNLPVLYTLVSQENTGTAGNGSSRFSDENAVSQALAEAYRRHRVFSELGKEKFEITFAELSPNAPSTKLLSPKEFFSKIQITSTKIENLGYFSQAQVHVQHINDLDLQQSWNNVKTQIHYF